MKDELRTIRYVLTGLIITLFLNFSNVRWQTRTYQVEIRMLKISVDSMRMDLIDRNHLDSLYHDHLKDCSYIDRESVKVGHNGVLYSQYHKKYKLAK